MRGLVIYTIHDSILYFEYGSITIAETWHGILLASLEAILLKEASDRIGANYNDTNMIKEVTNLIEKIAVHG